MQPGSETTQPQQTLRLREAVAIIVGIVIGAGIFKAPSLVAQFTGSIGWMLAAWVAGGVISLIGALCYAELAAAFAPIAQQLADAEATIVAELNGVQGHPVDIGGYYHPDEAKVAAVMRPSATLNAVIDAL